MGDCGLWKAQTDEKPKHVVEIDPFLIDAEPVSTTAFCRFLNSVGEVGQGFLADWFVLDPQDDRNQHMLIRHPSGHNGTDHQAGTLTLAEIR